MEGDFSRVSPFVIAKTLYGLIGETKNVSKTKDGLLVETKSNSQSERLLKVTRFHEFDVNVVPHNTLNTTKGVVYCPDLLNCPIDEILDEMKDQGIVNVQRIKTKKEGELVDTPNHIFTFNTPKLPTHIQIAIYKRLPVRPYIPAPLRCFRCQLFGHTASKCQGNQVCVCGKSIHEGSPCEQPISCVNCGGQHSARAKSCPKYKTEYAIQELKVTERLSYFEAKRRVNSSTPTVGVSYAQTTRTPASTPNPQIFISDLTPQIVDIVKKTIESSLGMFNTPFFRPHSESISSSVANEKRIPLHLPKKNEREILRLTPKDLLVMSKTFCGTRGCRYALT
nr:unnamed protein product [Callosobruchus chinensis]